MVSNGSSLLCITLGQLLSPEQNGLLRSSRTVEAAPLIRLELGVVDLDRVVDEEVAQHVGLHPLVERNVRLFAPVPNASESNHNRPYYIIRLDQGSSSE